MRTLFASAVVLSSLAAASVALASSMTVTGTVKSYDQAKAAITLDNGDMFMLPKNFKNPGLKTGEKIKIAYQKSGKNLEAEKVTIVH